MKGLLLKKVIVNEIKQQYEKYPFVVFYNYSNLDSESVFQIKRSLKNSGASWKVCKNSLIKKALFLDSILKNSNALVFCSKQNNNQFEVLNILYGFAKKSGFAERIQGGLDNNVLIDSKKLEKWANLPNAKVLLSQFCFYLFSPLFRLTFLLQKLVENKK